MTPGFQGMALMDSGAMFSGTLAAAETPDGHSTFCLVADHFLVRTCSLPFDQYERFTLDPGPVASDISERPLAYEADLQADISGLIHDEANAAFQSGKVTLSRQLVRLKRDIFNDRWTSAEQIFDSISGAISHHVGVVVGERISRHKQVELELVASDAESAAAIALARDGLKALVKNSTFIKDALLTASRDVDRRLNLSNETGGKNNEKKARRWEETLSAYLIRMATRPTPFGRFASVGIGRFVAEGPSSISLLCAFDRVRVSPDRKFLSTLIGQDAEVTRRKTQRILHLNDTLYKSDNTYHYLKTTVGGAVPADANEESFIHLKETATLTLLASLLQSRRGGIVQEEVEQFLAPKLTSPDRRLAVTRYLQALLDAQFLISARDPWAVAPDAAMLGRTVRGLYGQDLSSATKQKIEAAAQAMITIENGDLPSRRKAYAALDAIACGPHDSEGINARPTVYEDAYVEDLKLELDRGFAVELSDDLGRMLSLCAPAQVTNPGFQRATSLIRARYPADTCLLGIYEIWHQYEESIRVRAFDEDELMPEVARALYSQLASQYSRCMDQAKRVWNIDTSALLSTIKELNTHRMHPVCSSNVFLQLIEGEPHEVAVVNSVITGFGRYFSRFVEDSHGEHDSHCDTLRTYNSRYDAGGVMFCDIWEEFGSNANRRPALTQYVLRYPNSQREQTERDIHLSDVKVRMCHSYGFPQLMHVPSGRQIIPLNLGFVQETWLPRFHRFLMLFGIEHSHGPLTTHFERLLEGLRNSVSLDLMFYPRVSLGCLVLRRALYRLKGDLLTQLSEWLSIDNIREIRDFWGRHDLPNPCMIACSHDGRQNENAMILEGESILSSALRDRSVDHNNPSWLKGMDMVYCNIENFLSLRHLSKCLRNSSVLWVAEYISTVPLVNVDGATHQAELLIEAGWGVGR